MFALSKTKRKMKMKKIILKNSLIALILIIILAIPILFLQSNISVEAQTQYTNMQEGGSILLPSGVTPDVRVPTIACLSFRPNPVGIGQTILVNMWTLPATHAARYIKDYTVTIIEPDGSQEIIKRDSYRADATSWFEYVPDQVGTYKLKFDMPGAYWPVGNYSVDPGAWIGGQVVNFEKSVYHEPSSSPELTLTVQQEPVLSWPASTLPTDYWTRPIGFANREWATIGGWHPWYGVAGGPLWDELYPNTSPYWGARQRFTPWVQGPESPHVVWKRQGAISGIYGGDLGDYSGTSSGGAPNLVYAGRAYQSVTKVSNGETLSVWQCYDIRTGEIIWEKTDVPSNERATYVTYLQGFSEVPGGDPKFGMSIVLLNVAGGNVRHYDPNNGALIRTISIAPLTTGTLYRSDGQDRFVTVQNLGTAVPVGQRYRLIDWTVAIDPLASAGRSYYFKLEGNITWPWSSLGTDIDYNSKVAVSISDINAEQGARTARRVIAADMTTGAILWDKTFEETYYQSSHALADHGKLAMSTINGEFVALDLKTGQQVWRSEKMDYPWDLSFGAYSISSAYGYIYSARYSGVYAIDWNTGKIAWKYEAPARYPYDSPYINAKGESVYPFFTGSWVADGKIYIHNTEHTADQPLTRGWQLHCIDALTGEGIWKVGIHGSAGPVADGYIFVSGIDGYQYAIGKGPTKATITSSSTPIQVGHSFTITGSVLDISPAQEGTPAISDEDMSSWMEYLHSQMPKPTDAKGVEVQLTAIDPNNNLIEIGTATSDTDGVFGFTWTPEIPGLYRIIASFSGSESYGSSSASTYLTSIEAPETVTPETPPPQALVAEMYFVPAIVGIIASIVIGFALLSLLLLKKRT
jgi:outer membrane protein assembly factor BamB